MFVPAQVLTTFDDQLRDYIIYFVCRQKRFLVVARAPTSAFTQTNLITCLPHRVIFSSPTTGLRIVMNDQAVSRFVGLRQARTTSRDVRLVAYLDSAVEAVRNKLRCGESLSHASITETLSTKIPWKVIRNGNEPPFSSADSGVTVAPAISKAASHWPRLEAA